MGNISIAKGDYQKAEAILNNPYQGSRDRSFINWALGQTYYQLNMFDASQSYFENYLNAENDRYNLAHYSLGNIYANKGMKSKAVLEWRLSDAANHFDYIGSSYRAVNDWLNAAHNHDLAYQIDPIRTKSLAWSKYSLGQMALNENNLEIAASYFGEAIELDPNNYDAYLGLGSAMLRLGEMDKAEPIFSSALEINESSFWPHYYLGVIKYQQDQCSEAIEYLLTAQSMANDHQPTHIWLARSYIKCGFAQKAINEYKKALEINPEDIKTRKELEKLLP